MTKSTATIKKEIVQSFTKSGKDFLDSLGKFGRGYDAHDIGNVQLALQANEAELNTYVHRITVLNDTPEAWATGHPEFKGNKIKCRLFCWSLEDFKFYSGTGHGDNWDKAERNLDQSDIDQRSALRERARLKARTVNRGMVNADKVLNPEKYKRKASQAEADNVKVIKLLERGIDIMQKGDGDFGGRKAIDRTEMILNFKDIIKELS